MQKGLLVVISGPSGCGKGTIVKRLTERNEKICVSISCTTRSPRPGEREGVNYFYKTHEEFAKMLKANEFLEYAKVFDNYYGTPVGEVERLRKEGNDVILEIDVKGALKIKKKIPDAVMIFVITPSMKELKRRLTQRATETQEQIDKRFATAYLELGYINAYDYLILNDQLDVAVEQIENVLEVEKLKTFRTDVVKKLLKEGDSLL